MGIKGSPRSSLPRRPARPLIWMYSPELIQRKPPPSNLRALVNTTVLAGMFSPVEKVSVANKACDPDACQRHTNRHNIIKMLLSLSVLSGWKIVCTQGR